MRHFIYILALSILGVCLTKTTHSKDLKIKFCNEIITDSILDNIPTITYSKFRLYKGSNQNIEQKYAVLTQNQFNFFFTKEEQKEFSDYSKFKTYFLGKKKLGIDRLAIFLLCDADYLGIYLYCAIVNCKGELTGKFIPAYLELDAGYSIKGEGKFLNDSTYQFSEVNFEYIDSDHKKAKQDSMINIIEIRTNSIHTKPEIKFPTKTIIEN